MKDKTIADKISESKHVEPVYDVIFQEINTQVRMSYSSEKNIEILSLYIQNNILKQLTRIADILEANSKT